MGRLFRALSGGRRTRSGRTGRRGGRGRRRGRENFLEVAALFVGIGSVFLSFCGMPRCLAFLWPRSSLTLAAAYARLVLLVSLLALCSLLSLSGPDARHHGWFVPEGQFFSGLVLLVILHLALCFLPCCQAQDACRHRRTTMWRDVLTLLFTCPLCATRGGVGLRVQNCEFSEVAALGKIVSIPVVAQRLFPWSDCSSRPSRFLPYCCFRWSMSLLRCRAYPLSWRRGRFTWSRLHV